MKISAIISEYNPFHNGHRYLIEKVRENGASHIISIMGGNFLQRGNCAIADKYERAKAAVKGGVDVVLELPAVYACSSSERFALGAVGTLEGCGCVDELAFGSECGNIKLLGNAAEIISQNNDVERLCRELKKQGLSHPRAMEQAVRKAAAAMGDDSISDVLKNPNNTLAVEYIKALHSLKSNIQPFTTTRIGAAHDSEITDNRFASASAIREMILKNDNTYSLFVPKATREILSQCIENGECPSQFKNNERGLLSILRQMTACDFARIPDVGEGLENRIVKAVHENNTVSEIITAVKCKAYTHARLSRIITCAYLGITKETASIAPEYIRVLAFNGKGTEILKTMKKTASLPIVMSPAKDISKLGEKGRKLIEADLCASDLYGLLTPDIQGCGKDYYKGAVRI